MSLRIIRQRLQQYNYSTRYYHKSYTEYRLSNLYAMCILTLKPSDPPMYSTTTLNVRTVYVLSIQRNSVYFRTDLRATPIMSLYNINRGTAVAQSLSCCATNRKVVGSIPDGVTGIFHWHNPSDRTMALGSTQPLTEMSTRSISWG